MGNTILIADDNPPDLELLSQYFRESGFTVFAAGDCGEAIKLAGHHTPDCFLLDYYMGAYTAEKVCGFIRGDARISGRPIIVISGDPEQAIRSFDVCRADLFVDKDGDYRMLPALVRRNLLRAAWNRGMYRKADLVLDAPNLRLLRGSYPAIQLSAEQFRFFSLLFEKSPDFVRDEELCRYVFCGNIPECRAAVHSLVYRLREKLGSQLSRRLKNSRSRGWMYVQPRLHAHPRPALKLI